MSKKIIRKLPLWIFIAAILIIYVATYINQYSKAVKPDIRYYAKGAVTENYGLSYVVSGKMFSKEEMIKEFGIEEYIFTENGEYKKKYIVVEEKVTKTEDEINSEPNEYSKMNIYSKFWQTGDEIDLTYELQKKSKISTDELNVGEWTTVYRVFSIASCNLSKRLWNRAEKEVVWFEFVDTETCPYVRRVKIIN